MGVRAFIFQMSIPCDVLFFVGNIIFDPVTLTLEFHLFFKTFTLLNNFGTVSARALKFHINIPCDEIFFLTNLKK